MDDFEVPSTRRRIYTPAEVAMHNGKEVRIEVV
jgi:hypothetical protein